MRKATRLAAVFVAPVIAIAITIALQLFPSNPGEAAPPVKSASVVSIDQINDCERLLVWFSYENVSRTTTVELDVTKVGQNTFTHVFQFPHPFRNASPSFTIHEVNFTDGVNDGDMFQVDEIRLKDRKGDILLTVSSPSGGGPTAVSCPS